MKKISFDFDSTLKEDSYIKVIEKPKFNFFKQKITQYDLLGNKIKNWNSIKEASDVLKIHKQGICNCLKKEQNKLMGLNGSIIIKI